MGSVPDAPAPQPQDTGLPAAWIDLAHERGADRGGSPLRPASEAATIRVRDGQTLVTHGPFAELAEQIAGYQLLDVADLDEAIDLASAHPAARHGVVEIRPMWPF
ncbi:MAG: transcription initiation protein [Cellulomonadaceae bacterium]|nr:transcription initiation protein [Cellulomonadaceae bacterium]